MPNLFARTTPLPDLAGRLDYVANPDRQENLLAVYDSAESLLDGQYWEILARESREAFAQKGNIVRKVKDRKTGELIEQEQKCREAREVHLLLSNSLLDRMSPEEIAQTLSRSIEEKLGLPNRVAIHFNKTKKSLHAHVILPERRLLKEPDIRIAKQSVYFDATGKRRYRKSDILDANGQLLPGCRICKKGEVYQQRYFSNVDTDINTRQWLKNIKTNVLLPLRNGELRGDVEITEYDPASGKLAQQYVGPKVRGKKKAAIEAGNEMVKEYNALVDAGRVTHDEAMRNQEEYNRQADRNAYLAAKLEEIRLREHQERELLLRKAAERAKTQAAYSRPGWHRSSDGFPYRIGMYDEHGMKRSLIELVVILAVVTIRNEKPTATTYYSNNVIQAEVDHKVQTMMDTIRVAREEKVQTPAEIDERLNQVGKELSKARADIRRLTESKGKMDVLAQALSDYEELRELCEGIYAMPDDLDKHIKLAENAGNLERYKAAKANIYRAGLTAPEAREDFLERYQDICDKAAGAEDKADALKEQYNRLSKLRYNIQMAQNRQYCYDLHYLPDPFEEDLDQDHGQATQPQQEELPRANHRDYPER